MGRLVIIILIALAILLYFQPDFQKHLDNLKAQITPEFKQQRLKAEAISTSPLEFPNLRWNHMPLTVFIDSRTARKDSYPLDIKLALDTWKDATNGVISFELANNRDADITVVWTDKLKSDSLDAAGNTDIKFFNQTNFKILTKAEIQLLNEVDGRELTEFDMINLAMHEVGHALGLGHNDAEDSIMNPTLKIPSKDVISITKPEIEDLLDTYEIQPKPDLYIASNSTVTKIVDKRLFKENYYINAVISIQNIGIVDSRNATVVIKADGRIVREDEMPEVPIGAVFTRTYINQPVEKNFSTVEIVLDSENLIDELDERNNILVLKV